jgi:hypothetical protein
MSKGQCPALEGADSSQHYHTITIVSGSQRRNHEARLCAAHAAAAAAALRCSGAIKFGSNTGPGQMSDILFDNLTIWSSNGGMKIQQRGGGAAPSDM